MIIPGQFGLLDPMVKVFQNTFSLNPLEQFNQTSQE
jgi:hypothetical protein